MSINNLEKSRGTYDYETSGHASEDRPIDKRQRYVFAVVDLGPGSEWRSGEHYLSDVAVAVDLGMNGAEEEGGSTVYRCLGDMVKDVSLRIECDENGMDE